MSSSRAGASVERPGLTECGYNMHGRRHWSKALDAGDQRAALPIAPCKKRYQVDACREKPLASRAVALSRT